MLADWRENRFGDKMARQIVLLDDLPETHIGGILRRARRDLFEAAAHHRNENTMPDLAVRRLSIDLELIDLETPVEHHGNGLISWPEAEREKSAVELQGGAGQATTHRRIHALFNDRLLSTAAAEQFTLAGQQA